MDLRSIHIAEAVERLLKTIPPDVTLVAAAKGRSIEEVEAAIQAGVSHVGHNYVQEAKPIIEALGDRANWHMIGHLQRNKAAAAVRIFDMIETVDSMRLAEAIDLRCARLGRTMPVLVEINSGRERTKTGVLPEELDDLVASITKLKHVHLIGLMTMGPRFGDPEDARPFFKATREAFDRLSAQRLPNISLQYLSMGMTNSYQVAIEEGANLVRIGSGIFGPREGEA
ncbi:MAG: YggS family pyridoxal phosphate-dependent enzyme [Anaerolineaceae bacterium]|nr:MAG: YggS family pyridoxal phosphate-dependent enzyme [Anaerolineaceae bacterium]